VTSTLRDLDTVLERALAGTGAARDEALRIADAGATPLEDLLDAADRVRRGHRGEDVHFCAIVNARSGACSEDCAFCAQSARHAADVDAYPLRSPDEILAARPDAAGGIGAFGIVTSGPTVTDAEFPRLLEAVRRLRAAWTGRVCASLGTLRPEQLRALREAGLHSLHHNLETSEAFFPSICTTHAWRERVRTVRAAKAAGLAVCSGGLFGLGETWTDRVDLALALRDLGVTSVPLNFLNPVPGTPLGSRPPLPAEEALRIIALFRLLLPAATIRVCGGRPLVLGDQQGEIFRAGADALVTGNYLTTPGIDPDADRALVRRAGLTLRGAPPPAGDA
jgi:biotin synthase